MADLERVAGEVDVSTSRAGESFTCPHCGRDIEAEWVEFPDVLKTKYGKSGEIWYPPCTPECEAENDYREWAAERRNARRESLQKHSDLPARFSKLTFENFEPATEKARSALGAAQTYTKSFKDGICFVGSTGTGKTHLACAILSVSLMQGTPALFVTVPSLLERVRNDYRDDAEVGGLLEKTQNAEFLVLDDLGAEKPSEWVQEKLFALVNHRYSAELPTVVTTNLMPDELAERIGQRTVSRLAEMCRWVRLEGEDYRMRRFG